MKVLSSLIVLVLAVGVYSNCGCLKCNNENLHVLSPRGSGLKIIYKNQPCGCLTGVPYSVQVPVQPPAKNAQRVYGYQIQEARVAPAGIACPVAQEYNVQLQVPQSQPGPSYLVGLVAKTDRVLLSGPPEQFCPGSPQVQVETLPAVQDNDGDLSDWYYRNSRPGCGCFRYDRKIPKVRLIKPHQVASNPSLLKLQLLHSYTPPKPKGRFIPVIRRIYRQCFCHPRQQYQQVFLKVQPNLVRINSQNRLIFVTPNHQKRIKATRKICGRNCDQKINSNRLGSESKNFPESPNDFKPQQTQKYLHNNPRPSGTIQERPEASLSDISKNHEEVQNVIDSAPKLVINENNEQLQKPQTVSRKSVYRKPNKGCAQTSMENHAQKSNISGVNSQNFHMVKSQHLLLSKRNSGSKTLFLSTTHHFSAISDSLLAETLDRNRTRRSINLKLLALKPENPPRYLRMHNPAYNRGFHNHKHDEETSTHRTSLINRLRSRKTQQNNYGSSSHSTNPFSYNARNSGHGVNPQWYGQVGRHSGHGMNPQWYGQVGRHSGHGFGQAGYGINPSLHSWHRGGNLDQARKPLFGTEKLSRFPRENKRKKKKAQLKKKKLLPKKRKNKAISKSTLKRASKTIKNWFSKGSPLSAPQIQLPSYEPSKLKKHLPRIKRRIRDSEILPTFTFPEEKKRLGRRKALKEDKPVQKIQEQDPEEAFLQPLNFDHIFHPTPILHLLNTPIRVLNHYHKLKTHVSPVVGTIPKVIQVSRRYVISLLKNFGKNAIHIGSHFLKGFTTFKKSNLLRKRRHKRHIDEDDGKKEKEIIQEWGDDETGRAWNEYHDRNRNEWVEEETPIHIEDWENIDENNEKASVNEELNRFMENTEMGHDVETFDEIRKKRDVEGSNSEKAPAIDNIFTGFLRLLLGFGNIQANKEVVQESKKQKGDYGVDHEDLFEPKVVLLDSKSNIENPKTHYIQGQELTNSIGATKVERRKREIPNVDIKEVLGELENSGVDLKRFNALWKIVGGARNRRDVKLEEDGKQVSSGAPKVIKQRSKPSELELEVQAIKDTISKISSKIQTLTNYDVSKNLDVYQGLLKLQHIKTSIVQKWKSLNIEHEPQAKKKEFLIDLKEAQDLKSLIFKEILQRIRHQNIFKADWIKILIRLQKLHCVIKQLNETHEEQDSKIIFLESLDLVKSTNLKGIRASLQHNRDVNMKAQIERIQDLKNILIKGEAGRIKKEAKIIWEINNIEKLQKVSILELNQKLSQGLKIRKELKILFDLQKQLDSCEQNLYRDQ